MKIEKNVSLKKYCSYQTGGEAEYFAAPSSDDELVQVLLFAKDKGLKLTVLGSGCNVLVSDRGVEGLVLNTGKLNQNINIIDENVYAGAGVLLDRLILHTIKNSLGGLENMSGIPGSVGGAVSMNAGAFGTEIKDTAVYIDICSPEGEMSRINGADAGFGYRKAVNLKGIITGIMLKLIKSDTEKLLSVRKDILKKRNEKQPLDRPSCGSVFKRPEGGYAGALIEQCRLKGFSIGGAEVSEKHANFVVNKGGATSEDIYSLINHVQKTVHEKTGVMLEREVRFIGF